MIRALLLMAFAMAMPVAAAAPVTEQQTTKPFTKDKQLYAPANIPVDLASEKKFPNVDPKLIDELAFVNKVVNSAITYESDDAHYGWDDFWVMAPADGKGDCEDYALTKLFLIGQFGDKDSDPLSAISEISDIKLVGVMVHYKENGEWKIDGHEILAVRLPDSEVAYLDLEYDELMTRDELSHPDPVEQSYYQFYDWRA